MASTGRNRSGSLYRRWKGKEYAVDDKAALGKGVIWLRYMLNGKRHKISLKTPDTLEAKQKQKEFMAPLVYADEKAAIDQLVLKATQAQQNVDEEWEANNPPLTVEQAWDAYLTNPRRPDSGEGTLRNYSFQWKRFHLWHQKKHPALPLMRDVTDMIAEEYAADLSKAKLSPSTFNKHIRLVKLVFKTLQKPARLDANPFKEITTKKKLKTKSKRELTDDELNFVLKNAPRDLKTLLYLGAYTGMRLGDCALIKWNDVDMNDGVIKLTTSKTDDPIMIGIPAPLRNILTEIPETKRKGHVLPKVALTYKKDESKLTDQIQKNFTDCGIQTHKEGTGKTPEYEVALKEWHKGGEKGQKPTYKRAVTEVGFHSLRHTFVSKHAAIGTPQAVVQTIVGHGNPSMTRHYTHIGKETAKQAASALEAGIQDAEFEEVEDKTVPPWIVEILKTQTAKNWKSIRDELVKK